jgi:hypothetical protein
MTDREIGTEIKTSDTLILRLAQAWVMACHRRLWRRLRLRQRRAGARGHCCLALPQTANEKYAWRKIFDHDPRFVLLSDKLAVKGWVARLGRDVEIPKVLWSGTDARDIPPSVLEGDVVLKANHGWRMNIFVEHGQYDRARLVNTANRFLKESHGRRDYQWAYFDIPRQLFVEERIRPIAGDLTDLKIYVFGPHPEQIVQISEGPEGRAGAIWEPDPEGRFRMLDIKTAVSDRIDRRPLPMNIERALGVASAIGADFDHLRVDFLTDGSRLFLGEITIYNLGGVAHSSGHLPNTPLNRSWDLRRSWFMRSPQRGWRKVYAAALRRAIDREALRMPRYDGGNLPALPA